MPPRKHEFATIGGVTFANGATFKEGDKLRHRKDHYTGTLREIEIPIRGAGVTRFKITPDDPDHKAHIRDGWPPEGGGRFIFARDIGYPAHHWEHDNDLGDDHAT